MITNKVRAAYNRAEYLHDRADMLQQWADMVDNEDNNVIYLSKKKELI